MTNITGIRESLQLASLKLDQSVYIGIESPEAGMQTYRLRLMAATKKAERLSVARINRVNPETKQESDEQLMYLLGSFPLRQSAELELDTVEELYPDHMGRLRIGETVVVEDFLARQREAKKEITRFMLSDGVIDSMFVDKVR